MGARGLDAVAAVQLYEALSTSDPGFGLAVLAHSVLFAHNLAINGSPEQCLRFLPDAVSGKSVAGMCMTEPEAGTDVLGMRTRAEREGDAWVLNGVKTYITNGGVDENTLGDVFIVYARTGERRLSAFLVEKDMPGFRLGQKWMDKLGMRASFTAELVFDGVHVPHANLMGVEGEGTRHMMRNLEIERLTLAAQGSGHRAAFIAGHGRLRARAPELSAKPLQHVRADPALHRRDVRGVQGDPYVSSTIRPGGIRF